MATRKRTSPAGRISNRAKSAARVLWPTSRYWPVSKEELRTPGGCGMSTAMHTPGPWNVFAGDNYQVRSPLMPREFPHRFKSDSTGDFVAYVGNHAADFGEANAHLIAAAPDMLAALEQIMSDGYPSIKWWDDARAAIAKAKGGAA